MIDIVHHLVEDALRELADEPYQRQLWLASEGPEVSSFEECISRLWYDSGLVLALEKDEIVYSPEIDDRLRQLRTILRRVDPLRAPQVVLDDPQLQRARSVAAQVLQDVTHLVSDDD